MVLLTVIGLPFHISIPNGAPPRGFVAKEVGEIMILVIVNDQKRLEPLEPSS